MPWRWLSLLLCSAAVFTLPYHNANRPNDEIDNEESRKVLGSSVVTSVSVIMDLGNGTKKYFADPVGKPVPKPTAAEAVGSPPSLLSPDRYEFYTFDETGDLVKRLMTLEEIQSIIAGGEGDTIFQHKPSYYHQNLPLEIKAPLIHAPIDEGTVEEMAEDALGEYSSPVLGVREVVANVQNVLKNELEAKRNQTPITATFPPASINPTAEWSSFIPSAQFISVTPDVITSSKPAKLTTKTPVSTSRKPVTSTKRPTSTTSRPTSPISKPTTLQNQITSTSKEPLTSSKPLSSTTKRPNENISVTRVPATTNTVKSPLPLYQSTQQMLKITSQRPETTYVKISQSTPSIGTEKPHSSTTTSAEKNYSTVQQNNIPISALTDSDLTVIKNVVNNTIASAAQNATASPPPFAILSTSYTNPSKLSSTTFKPSSTTFKPSSTAFKPSLTTFKQSSTTPKPFSTTSQQSSTTFKPPSTSSSPEQSTTLKSISNAITVVTSQVSESTLPPLEVLLELIQNGQLDDSSPSTVTSDEQAATTNMGDEIKEENYGTTYSNDKVSNTDIPLTAMESNIMTKISNSTNKLTISTDVPLQFFTFTSNSANPDKYTTTSKLPLSSVTSSTHKLTTNKIIASTRQPPPPFSKLPTLPTHSDNKMSSSSTTYSKVTTQRIPVSHSTGNTESVNNDHFSTTLKEEQSTSQYTEFTLPPANGEKIFDSNTKSPYVGQNSNESTSAEREKPTEATTQYSTNLETQTIKLYGAPQDEIDIAEELADSVSSLLSQFSPEQITTILPPEDETAEISTTNSATTLSEILYNNIKNNMNKGSISVSNVPDANNFLKIASSESNTESVTRPETTTFNNNEDSTMQLVSSSEGIQKNGLKTKYNPQNKAEFNVKDLTKPGEITEALIKPVNVNLYGSSGLERTTLNNRSPEFSTDSTETLSTTDEEDMTDQPDIRFAQSARERTTVSEADETTVEQTTNELLPSTELTPQNRRQDNEKFTTLEDVGTTNMLLDFTTTVQPVTNDKVLIASQIKGTQVKYINEENVYFTTESDSGSTIPDDDSKTANDSTAVNESTEYDAYDTTDLSTFSTETDDTTTKTLSKSSEDDSEEKGETDSEETTTEIFSTTTKYEETTLISELGTGAQKADSILLKNVLQQTTVDVSDSPITDKYTESDLSTIQPSNNVPSLSDSPTSESNNLQNQNANTTNDVTKPLNISSNIIYDSENSRNETLIATEENSAPDFTTDKLWTLISTVSSSDSTEAANSTSSSSVHPLRIGSANENTSAGTYPILPPPYTAIDLYPAPEENLGLESTTIKLDSDVRDFSSLCNELAFRLWGSLSSKGLAATRSLVLSPFAATALLAMVFLGARGSTSGQMNDILRLDDMVTFNPHQVFRNVTESVVLVRNPGIATAAFVRELFSDKARGKLLDFYKERAQQFYDGHVEEVGFSGIGDILKRRTNMLIKRQTFNKVPEYLRNTNFNLRPPLAAFSANIFQTACQEASTEGRDGEMYFTVTPSTRQRRLVPIPAAVWRTGFLAGYDAGLDATAVAIGNGLGEESLVSTIFVLPGQQGQVAPGDGLMRLEKRLIKSSHTKGSWSRLLRSLLFRPGLEVQIPRFSHRSLVNITGPLQRMGLKDLFAEGKADLRGLNGLAQDLHLSDIVQVNTFGTCGEETRDSRHHVEIFPSVPNRAARDDERDYLSHEKVPLALRPRQARLPDNPRLRFDRPFLYFVRHNPTGLVLYMGRFNPRLLH